MLQAAGLYLRYRYICKYVSSFFWKTQGLNLILHTLIFDERFWACSESRKRLLAIHGSSLYGIYYIHRILCMRTCHSGDPEIRGKHEHTTEISGSSMYIGACVWKCIAREVQASNLCLCKGVEPARQKKKKRISVVCRCVLLERLFW